MREQLGVAPSRDFDTATVEWTHAQVVPRVTTVISADTPIFDVSYPHSCLDITNLTEDIISMTAGMTGTAHNFWKLMVRIYTPASQLIEWGDAFFDSGVAGLPPITQPGKTHQIGLEYNLARDQWACLASDILGY